MRPRRAAAGLHPWTRIPVLALLAVLAPAPVAGAPVPDLYEARVPVADGGSASLEDAFARALGAVLVKVSGRRSPGGPGLVANAGSLVRQYQPLPGGLIRVQFDPGAVRGRLDGAALPVWGADRPATLVWMRLPGGAGRVLDSGSSPGTGPALPATSPLPAPDLVTPDSLPPDPQQALRQQVLATAELRGLPVRLPAAGSGGDPAAEAARMGAALLLLGEPAGPAGSWRWTLAPVGAGAGDPGGGTPWTGDGSGGIHGLADRLAARFAGSVTAIQPLSLVVTGVGSFPGFARLQHDLESLEDVEGITIRRVQGDRVHYTVTLRGDAGRLRELLARQGLLVPEDPGPGSGPGSGSTADVLWYRLAPVAP